MARTIKTTPWRARIAAEPTKLAVAHHDHRNGVCELEDEPRRLFGHFGECYLKPSLALRYGPGHGCGCAMCTEKDERRAGRRRDRYKGRAEARREARELGDELEGDFFGGL